jgi:hypothetical protein
MEAEKSAGRYTLAFFGLALLVGPSIYACLQYLILTLELVFELILELSRLVLLIDLHGPIAIFDGVLLLL